MAKHYGVPVVLHSDHCAKKLLPWFDGMLEADEEYFKVGEGDRVYYCPGLKYRETHQYRRLFRCSIQQGTLVACSVLSLGQIRSN